MYKIKRGKTKIKVDYGFKELYKFYKSGAENPIPSEILNKLLREYNNEILRMVIYDGLDYSMYFRLGSIRIKKRDNSLRLGEDGEVENKLKVDWPKTHSLWTSKYPNKSFEELKKIRGKPLVYHLNEHTDGYVFRWFWDKVTSNIPNQSAYRFRAVRGIRREAAKAWKTYPELKNLYYE